MDAQQRLLLERSFEALAAELAGANAQRTAVFVGIGTVDYVTMSAHLGVGMYVASGSDSRRREGCQAESVQRLQGGRPACVCVLNCSCCHGKADSVMQPGS